MLTPPEFGPAHSPTGRFDIQKKGLLGRIGELPYVSLPAGAPAAGRLPDPFVG